MSICLCYFSYAPDGPALISSVASMRRVYGDDVAICIYDDSTAPLDEAVINAINPHLYAITTFDRGGNLKTIASVIGCLSCYADAIDRTGADYVAKVDCDTTISRDWLDCQSNWALQGLCMGTACLACGCFYSLRGDVPAHILQSIDSRPHIFRGSRSNMAEDYCISLFATVYYPREVLLHDTAAGSAERRILCGPDYSSPAKPQIDLLDSYDVVTWGNRYTIPKHISRDIHRPFVARCMRQHLEGMLPDEWDFTLRPNLPADWRGDKP